MYFSLHLGDTVTPKLSNTYWTLKTVGSAFEEAGVTDILRALPGVLLEARKT